MHSIGRDNRLLTKVKASGKEQVHLNRGIKPPILKVLENTAGYLLHHSRNLHLFRYIDQEGKHLYIYWKEIKWQRQALLCYIPYFT